MSCWLQEGKLNTNVFQKKDKVITNNVIRSRLIVDNSNLVGSKSNKICENDNASCLSLNSLSLSKEAFLLHNNIVRESREYVSH